MDKVSLNLNMPLKNKNSVNINNDNYTPSYLAYKNEQDSVSFTGKNPNMLKKGVAKVGVTVMAALTALGGVFGLTSCKNNDNSGEDFAIYEQQDDSNIKEIDKNNNAKSVNHQAFSINSEVPVATIFSTKIDNDEKIVDKKLKNILNNSNNSKDANVTQVVTKPSTEPDKCTTLSDAINKQYVDPKMESGKSPKTPSEAETKQIAAEIIENNKDMQDKIAKHYNVNNWQEADIDSVLNENLHEMGIDKFETPREVGIYGVSTKANLDEKVERKTTLYSASSKTIELKHDEIEDVNDIYTAVGAKYKTADGKTADSTAGSVATWFMIKDNQYNKAFEGKINDDNDRTPDMLLDTIKGLKKGESLKLNLPDTFGVNHVTSGKTLSDVKEGQTYSIIHQMTPSENSFELSSDDIVSDSEKTASPVDFIDILQYYFDPDTEEPLATKTENNKGNYEFKYNNNVAGLTAKTYAVSEQVAYDNMHFFASGQKFETKDGVKEFEYGVFDVQEGHKEDVESAIDKKDYDSAKKYLTLNMERFLNGSFYNEDGTLKTDKNNLKINLKQLEYVSEEEGKKEVAKSAPSYVPSNSTSNYNPTPTPDYYPTPTPTPKPNPTPIEQPTLPPDNPNDDPEIYVTPQPTPTPDPIPDPEPYIEPVPDPITECEPEREDVEPDAENFSFDW